MEVTQTTYGKWLATNHERRIGVIGETEIEAILLLREAEIRADRLEAHFRDLQEVDEPLSGHERESIAESRAQFERGEFRVVTKG